MNSTLHEYIDDIIIWSNSIDEHKRHIKMVMNTLENAKLFCNEKKCKISLLELDYLGHHISAWRIKPNASRIQQVLDWPAPQNSTNVWAFLGLVCYLVSFLPHLAEQMQIITPLTTKDTKLNFNWNMQHETAFNAIKILVAGLTCLMVIDHSTGNNKIFMACDASDWYTGACLSFGETWETACPVAYDSMQLNSAEQNYPIHKKELLSIICALMNWHLDLLGSEFMVYTDHRTLKSFNTQYDLSKQQLWWQEFISQYEMSINYIHGEDNMVADALSQLPLNTSPDEWANTQALHKHWKAPTCTVLQSQWTPLCLYWSRVRSLLSVPCKHWHTGSTTYQWSLVHWGLPCYSSHGKHLWKSVPPCTWHTWTLQHQQILYNTEGHILLAKYEVWPWKIVHPLMWRMLAQQISNQKDTQATTSITCTRWTSWKCDSGFH